MTLPILHGIIRRRILVNFRVSPQAIQAQLAPRFRPKLHEGFAIAGICLIRLEELRPKMLPAIAGGVFGLSSENAAHRIAVLWDDHGAQREGVFIPRRDTNSMVTHLAGAHLFPGEQHHATFAVTEKERTLDFQMCSDDKQVSVRLKGRFDSTFPSTSCFRSIEEASRFFEGGSVGYSATRDPRRLDGIRLQTEEWFVEPLEVEEVYSSYFADTSRFPAGSVTFDCALLMRNIRHEWHSLKDLDSGLLSRTA